MQPAQSTPITNYLSEQKRIVSVLWLLFYLRYNFEQKKVEDGSMIYWVLDKKS